MIPPRDRRRAGLARQRIPGSGDFRAGLRAENCRDKKPRARAGLKIAGVKNPGLQNRRAARSGPVPIPDPAFLFEFEREEQLTYGDKKKRHEDDCSTGQ